MKLTSYVNKMPVDQKELSNISRLAQDLRLVTECAIKITVYNGNEWNEAYLIIFHQ